MFHRLPNEIRCVEVSDYELMLASIGEFPCVDEAFYLSFCGGGKTRQNDFKSMVAKSSSSSLERRKKVIRDILGNAPA